VKRENVNDAVKAFEFVFVCERLVESVSLIVRVCEDVGDRETVSSREVETESVFLPVNVAVLDRVDNVKTVRLRAFR
jgi:hypothetical protein